MTADRTISRALRAGALTAAVLAVASTVAVLAGGGTGAGVAVFVMMALVLGILVCAGWLVLSVILDLLAGHMPDRRRLLWTAVAFVIAFVSPVLVLGALRAAV